MRMQRLKTTGIGALFLLALQAISTTSGYAQSEAFKNLDTLDRMFRPRSPGSSDKGDLVDSVSLAVLSEIARLAILQKCLIKERNTKQMQVGPFQYYQPSIKRPGNSALPFVVESQVFESADILMVAGRCFRGFRVTRIAEGSPVLKQKLRVGDRIFAMDGYLFRGRDDFFEYLSNRVVGTEAAIGILRAESTRPDVIIAQYEDRERIIKLNPPRR
jgi:membrane-associated protease RseP (regulator of RpoE activity)